MSSYLASLKSAWKENVFHIWRVQVVDTRNIARALELHTEWRYNCLRRSFTILCATIFANTFFCNLNRTIYDIFIKFAAALAGSPGGFLIVCQNACVIHLQWFFTSLATRDKYVCGPLTLLHHPGRTGRVDIISIVDKIRSLSIEFDTNQSTNIGNR